MLEAAVAAIGLCVCGYLARMFAQVGSEQDSIVCTLFSMPLYVIAVYCFVRFVAWAWATPIPFVSGR